MRNIVPLLLLLLLNGLHFGQAPASRNTPALVLTHVTVIDVTGAPTRSDMTVVVSGNRIAAVGRNGRVPVPQNAHVINAKGKFLLPGLWDMHIHALHKPRFETFLPLLVAHGVTGIRDMATHTPLEEVSQWKKEIDSHSRIGPRILTAGLILDGPKPLNPTVSIAIKDEKDGRNAVIRMKEEGADFIKVYSRLSRSSFYAIADEAKRQGISFAGHLPTSVTACEASEAGQKSIEHMIGWFESCSTKATSIRQSRDDAGMTSEESGPVLGMLKQVTDAQKFDDRTANELTKILSKNDTWLTPTLSARWTFSYHDEKLAVEDVRLKYISTDMRESWKTSGVLSQFNTEQLAKLRSGFPAKLKAVNRVHRAGGKFLAGTDTGVNYVFPGFSLHQELELFVKAGLTPLEALQTATLNPAKFIGREKELGTVEQGKLADLVLLDANPLADISNIKKINAVIANGRYLDRNTLDRMLADVEAAVNKQ